MLSLRRFVHKFFANVNLLRLIQCFMKTLLFLSFVLLFVQTSNAQLTKDVTWLDVSLKGGFGLSMLKNFNISNDDNVVAESFNSCTFAGLKIGTTTAEKLGIYLEADYISFNQKYNVSPNNNGPFTKSINMTALDNALVVRYNHYSGAFIEFGAKYSLLMSATAIYNIHATASSNGAVDVTADYKSSFMSLTGGLGMKIFQSTKDRYRINLFSRFTYGLTDMMKDASLNPVKSVEYTTGYAAPAKTTPFFLQLGLEFTYYAGYRSASSGIKKNVFGSSTWHFD